MRSGSYTIDTTQGQGTDLDELSLAPTLHGRYPSSPERGSRVLRAGEGGGTIRIERLRTTDAGGRRRVSADVVWEDHDRAPQELFFESSNPDATPEPNPHAFLVAVAPPALARRERRIRVEGSVSPRLRDGLVTALRTIALWQRPGHRIPTIEASGGFRPTRPAPSARAGMLLSGGVDSLALLRKNRLEFPMDHPRSVATAFFVDGFDVNAPGSGDETAHYRESFEVLKGATDDAALTLVPVRTNVRELGSRWPEEHHGAAGAAVAHACSGLVRRVEAAGSYTWETVFRYGSHPILDLHYSSDDLTVDHTDMGRSRLEKLRMIGDWPAGLGSLRVCWVGERLDGQVNCGVCHKCVLTLLELVAIGRLDDCPTFPVDAVTPELADRLHARQRSSLPFFRELPEPLEARGRRDLADVVRRKIRSIETRLRRQGRPFWARPFAVRRP